MSLRPELESLDFCWFQGASVQASVLQSVCMFRSHVLYDNGFRKNFEINGKSYGDIQYSDFESFHIVATEDDTIWGTIRITPKSSLTVARSVLGEEEFQKLLISIGEMGNSVENVIEINRLMIDPNFRNSSLGQTLMFAAIGLIEILFNRTTTTILGTAGNCTKQLDFFMKYTDYVKIPKFNNANAPQFNDEVTFMIYEQPPYTKGKAEISKFSRQFRTGNRLPTTFFKKPVCAIEI